MSLRPALKLSSALVLLLTLAHAADAQSSKTSVFAGPTDPRAVQAYKEAAEFERHHNVIFALEN